MSATCKIFSRVVVCGLLVLGMIVLSPPVHAEGQQPTTASTQSALAVSPAMMEEVIEPGKSVSFSLQVNNITNFPLPIKSTVRDLSVQSQELEKTERGRLDASQWFTIEDPDFILQPKQTRVVKGTLQAPTDAVPGGHYATIFFQPLVPREALNPATAYINSKVGVLAFLIVKGDIEQKAAFSKKLQTAGLVSHGPVEFTFSIHNSGNVHLQPTGKIIIYDWRGHRVAKLDLPPGIILPDATKEYSMQWNEPSGIGKYRAELEATYGTEHASLGKTVVTFWIIPWVEMLTAAALLGIGTLLVVKTRYRWRKAWQVLHGKDVKFH